MSPPISHGRLAHGNPPDIAITATAATLGWHASMDGETELVRIARIGDSVFAVTLTLLAYRVRIPGHDELISGKLAPLLPFVLDLWAVVLSFLVVSMFWISHWRVFRRMRHSDIKFVALSLAFLGTLTLLPISTSIVSSNYGTKFGALVYSASLLITATAGLFVRMHARTLDPQAFGPGLLLAPSLAVLLFGGATLVSRQWPLAAAPLWFATLLTPIVESRWGIGRKTT
jgi:uncharacterized membrane protein